MRELEGEERREVDRILREVTSAVRVHVEDIREGLRALAVFDLLQAKARFANDLDAVVPDLNVEGVIDIIDGRNPVLMFHFRDLGATARDTAATARDTAATARDAAANARDVVPLNLRLGDDYRTLVITGPNAGGKTVAMKTVGLFAMMLGHGLPVPVDEKSSFGIFQQLYVDIGDEQSIEEDLSTFSSHVSNLKTMLANAGSDSLVLIDEAGTGTDPAEGGALAQAVLERLTERDARTIATTHHGTLKVFAHEKDGVENGSMEFDQSTLSPTYRFQPGIPGSSYAFEIAQRIGLDETILERARELVGEQKTALEELITTFESRTQELDAKLAEAEDVARRARNERDQFRRKAEKLDREREAIRHQALKEAERIVGEANARIEKTIREIKEAEAEREATKGAREELASFREDLDQRLAEPESESDVGSEPASEFDGRSERPGADSERVAPRPGQTASGPEPPEMPKPVGGSIEVGDQVVLDDGSTAAEVLEIEDDEAVISLNSMRLRTALDRLQKVGGKRKQQVQLGTVEQSGGEMTALTARSRIDLRGRRVHEAIEEVTRLIDEALVSNLSDIEILHGKGTGALRQAIHEYLAEREDVVSFEEAPWDQGGAGVTYVHLS
ncbi:MAG: Smr/MutS family protein [Rhodothermales bacterium]